MLAAASMAAAAHGCGDRPQRLEIDVCVLCGDQGSPAPTSCRDTELNCRHTRFQKLRLLPAADSVDASPSEIEVAADVQNEKTHASRPQAHRDNEPHDSPAARRAYRTQLRADDGVGLRLRPEDEHRVGADCHNHIDLVGVATQRHDLLL